MAAGLGFKTFTTGEVLTAADTNGYLMQGVLVFASAAARNAAITSPQEGQFAYTKDTNGLWYYDGAAWVASGATGDIEGVTAGTGISGGGTSGTVTITNSMATEITAAGDIIVGTGSGTFDNLPIGTTNQILTADTTVSPYKVKWATPTSSTLPTFSASKITTDQTFAANTFVKITFNSEAWDTNNNFASSTFTPTVAGYYQITAALYHGQVGNGDFQGALYKNGTRVKRLYIRNTIAGQVTLDNSSCLVYCNGSTDYIELYGRGDSGGDVTIYASAETTYFEGIGIRA